jgi:hypothetical protein
MVISFFSSKEVKVISTWNGDLHNDVWTSLGFHVVLLFVEEKFYDFDP